MGELQEKHVKRVKPSKEVRAAEQKEAKEQKSQAKLVKIVDKSLVEQLASHLGSTAEGAARILVRANQGDAVAKRSVREARTARNLETRIRLTAFKGGLTTDAA